MTFGLYQPYPVCVDNGKVAREYSILSTRFTTCLSYFMVESKITRDFEAQCSLFTYSRKEGHVLHGEAVLTLLVVN